MARYRRLAARPSHAAHVARCWWRATRALLKADLAYEGFFKGGGKPGFDDGLRASLDYDFRDRLPEVRVPTLIVWGEKDSIIPARDADEFERLIEDSRKVVMKDTRPHADGRAPRGRSTTCWWGSSRRRGARRAERLTGSRRRLSAAGTLPH